MWMIGTGSRRRRETMTRSSRLRSGEVSMVSKAVWVLLAAAVGTGCSPRVKVEAPDKPIEINVNVKIEQEVRIKLDKTIEQTLQENPELFGTEVKP